MVRRTLPVVVALVWVFVTAHFTQSWPVGRVFALCIVVFCVVWFITTLCVHAVRPVRPWWRW